MSKTDAISCENCGLCCMHMRTPPFLGPTDPEFMALPEALRREYLTWIESPRIDLLDSRGQEDSPCIWLNQGTGRCRHYASRPQVCRDFEAGSEACLAFRSLDKNPRLISGGRNAARRHATGCYPLARR